MRRQQEKQNNNSLIHAFNTGVTALLEKFTESGQDLKSVKQEITLINEHLQKVNAMEERVSRLEEVVFRKGGLRQ